MIKTIPSANRRQLYRGMIREFCSTVQPDQIEVNGATYASLYVEMVLVQLLQMLASSKLLVPSAGKAEIVGKRIDELIGRKTLGGSVN